MPDIWRAGTQLLVRDGDTFARIDAGGTVVERYRVRRQCSDEDDLWTWEHVVDGPRFCERTTIDHGFLPVDIRQEEKILLDGLTPTEDADAAAIVARALGRDAAARAEEAARKEREADARIAAIEGATEDHGLGNDFANAQRWLVHRVRAYDEREAAALLRTLVAVARARPAAPVVQAYVRGCLLAASAKDEPPPLPDAEPSNDGGPDAGELAGELAARADELEAWADGQEWVDNHRGAADLREAWQAVAYAAKLAGFVYGPAPR